MAIPFNRGALRSIGWMSSVREPPSPQTETSVTKSMKAAGMSVSPRNRAYVFNVPVRTNFIRRQDSSRRSAIRDGEPSTSSTCATPSISSSSSRNPCRRSSSTGGGTFACATSRRGASSASSTRPTTWTRTGRITPCMSSFIPKGLRRFIVNWTDFAGRLVQILHREVAQGSRTAAKLRDEILVYPGVPAGWKVPQSPPSSPVMTMRLRKGDLSLDFFSMFTTFAMPHEVALQQLKIECFYPPIPRPRRKSVNWRRPRAKKERRSSQQG